MRYYLDLNGYYTKISDVNEKISYCIDIVDIVCKKINFLKHNVKYKIFDSRWITHGLSGALIVVNFENIMNLCLLGFQQQYWFSQWFFILLSSFVVKRKLLWLFDVSSTNLLKQVFKFIISHFSETRFAESINTLRNEIEHMSS